MPKKVSGLQFLVHNSQRGVFDSFTGWKWRALVGAFVGGGVYVFCGHFKHLALDHGNPAGITDFNTVRLLWTVYGRSRSRWFGWLMERPVAPSLRPAMYSTFAKVLGIDLEECRYPVTSYKSLAHVFARTLKDGLRPIARPEDEDSMVVPCDGAVVNLGVIDFNAKRVTQLSPRLSAKRQSEGRSDVVQPIKGATFRVDSFLGLDPRFGSDTLSNASATCSEGRQLVYAVIYLAPKNYHHFHAPCEFGITTRRHMPGFVLPVFTGLVSRINDLFSVNERVVLSGFWKYGQMHYAAVAAYNVGQIRLKYEPGFRTNCLRTQYYPTHRVMNSEDYCNPSFGMDFVKPTTKAALPPTAPPSTSEILALWTSKGERLGEFRMGSTIVLIFETPKEAFKWDVEVGSTVRMGQLLCHVEKNKEQAAAPSPPPSIKS